MSDKVLIGLRTLHELCAFVGLSRNAVEALRVTKPDLLSKTAVAANNCALAIQAEEEIPSEAKATLVAAIKEFGNGAEAVSKAFLTPAHSGIQAGIDRQGLEREQGYARAQREEIPTALLDTLVGAVVEAINKGAVNNPAQGVPIQEGVQEPEPDTVEADDSGLSI